MIHSFDVEIAKEYGVNAAIIFQHIGFWCMRSKVNEIHLHDGYYWTYNKNSAMCKLFPYMTSKAIRGAIQKLVDAGLIVKGSYNQMPFDRTLWYAVTEKGESLLGNAPSDPIQDEIDEQKGQLDVPKRAIEKRQKGQFRSAQKGRPIPDIYTDNITDINNIPPYSPPKGKSDDLPGFDEFWKAYPKKKAKVNAEKAWKKLKANDSLLQAILKDIEHKIDGEWKNKDVQFIPYPATYLNQRRWEDEADDDSNTRYYSQPTPEELEAIAERDSDRYWAEKKGQAV